MNKQPTNVSGYAKSHSLLASPVTVDLLISDWLVPSPSIQHSTFVVTKDSRVKKPSYFDFKVGGITSATDYSREPVNDCFIEYKIKGKHPFTIVNTPYEDTFAGHKAKYNIFWMPTHGWCSKLVLAFHFLLQKDFRFDNSIFYELFSTPWYADGPDTGNRGSLQFLASFVNDMLKDLGLAPEAEEVSLDSVLVMFNNYGVKLASEGSDGVVFCEYKGLIHCGYKTTFDLPKDYTFPNCADLTAIVVQNQKLDMSDALAWGLALEGFFVTWRKFFGSDCKYIEISELVAFLKTQGWSYNLFTNDSVVGYKTLLSNIKFGNNAIFWSVFDYDTKLWTYKKFTDKEIKSLTTSVKVADVVDPVIIHDVRPDYEKFFSQLESDEIVSVGFKRTYNFPDAKFYFDGKSLVHSKISSVRYPVYSKVKDSVNINNVNYLVVETRQDKSGLFIHTIVPSNLSPITYKDNIGVEFTVKSQQDPSADCDKYLQEWLLQSDKYDKICSDFASASRACKLYVTTAVQHDVSSDWIDFRLHSFMEEEKTKTRDFKFAGYGSYYKQRFYELYLLYINIIFSAPIIALITSLKPIVKKVAGGDKGEIIELSNTYFDYHNMPFGLNYDFYKNKPDVNMANFPENLQTKSENPKVDPAVLAAQRENFMCNDKILQKDLNVIHKDMTKFTHYCIYGDQTREEYIDTFDADNGLMDNFSETDSIDYEGLAFWMTQDFCSIRHELVKFMSKSQSLFVTLFKLLFTTKYLIYLISSCLSFITGGKVTLGLVGARHHDVFFKYAFIAPFLSIYLLFKTWKGNCFILLLISTSFYLWYLKTLYVFKTAFGTMFLVFEGVLIIRDIIVNGRFSTDAFESRFFDIASTTRYIVLIFLLILLKFYIVYKWFRVVDKLLVGRIRQELSYEKESEIFSSSKYFTTSLSNVQTFLYNKKVSMTEIYAKFRHSKSPLKYETVSDLVPTEYVKYLHKMAPASIVSGLWAFLIRASTPLAEPEFNSRRLMRGYKGTDDLAKELSKLIITNPFITFPDYVKSVLRRKQQAYMDGYNRFMAKPLIPAKMVMICKPDEKQHQRGGTLDAFCDMYKPRNIYNPSEQVKGVCGWFMQIIMAALKNYSTYKVNFAAGQTPLQLSENIKIAWFSLKDPVFISWDGKRHDSLQHVWFLEDVDNVLLRELIPVVGRLVGFTPYQIDRILDNLTAIDIDVEMKVKYPGVSKKSKLSTVLKAKVHGTVFSGLPGRTTFGNTTRILLLVRFAAERCGFVFNKDFFHFQAGDDTLLVMERQHVDMFQTAIQSVYDKYGLIMQDFKVGSTFEFLSRNGFVERGNVYLVRFEDRVCQTGLYSSKVDKPLMPAFDKAITSQISAWGAGSTGVSSLIKWRRRHEQAVSNISLSKVNKLLKEDWKILNGESAEIPSDLVQIEKSYLLLDGACGNPIGSIIRNR